MNTHELTQKLQTSKNEAVKIPLGSTCAICSAACAGDEGSDAAAKAAAAAANPLTFPSLSPAFMLSPATLLGGLARLLWRERGDAVRRAPGRIDNAGANARADDAVMATAAAETDSLASI